MSIEKRLERVEAAIEELQKQLGPLQVAVGQRYLPTPYHVPATPTTVWPGPPPWEIT